MNPKFAPLFQGFTLNNGVRIMNRLAVAPMTHFASHPDGSISEEERVFLRARADHVGLFITAATLVASDGKAFIGQPEAVGEKDLPSLREVAGIIQARGAKAILQIHHGGKLSIHGLLNGGEIVAPSADLELAARALDDAQIETLIHSFANAADLAIRAGFDGVEIHGANGYLLQQFYSAQSNRRRDCWGGDRERRLKFPLAVVDAVLSTRERRQRTDFIVGYRFSPEEPGENGLTMDDTFVLLDALVQRPLQYLHVSLWDFHKRARRGANPRLTRMQLIHERIGGKLPLVGVGNLLGADEMLAAFLTGWAEFIALGKAILMNPDVATLIARGRESEIVKVIDPANRDRYGIPGRLWEQNMRRLSYLPQVKD